MNRGGVEALKQALAHRLLQLGAHALGGLQCGLLALRADHHEMPDVRRAEVAAQFLVEQLLARRHGAQAREIGAPQRSLFQHQDRGRRGYQDEHRRQKARRYAQHRECAPRQDVDRRDAEIRGHELRQHPARDPGGDDQADDREKAELRESRESRKEHGTEAANRGEHAEPQRRPDALKRSLRRAAGRFLGEEIDRVVDALADQRDAKAERDAVHRAKGKAHGGDARERAARDRQEPEPEYPRRAIERQQQGGDQRRRHQRKPPGVALDALARHDGKHPGTRDEHFRIHAGKGAADRLSRVRLTIDVGAARARLRNEQRAVAIGGKPHAVLRRRSPLRGELLDQPQELPARIGRECAADEHPGRRGEQLQVLLQALTQCRGGKALRLDCGTQEVAVLPEEIAVPRMRERLAVIHRDERGIGAQRRGQALAVRRELDGRCALDTDEDEAGDHAIAQLLDQELLLGRR